MKLPNGYGSITKLSGKRRKPWMVRVTKSTEYDEKIEDYKLVRVTLGYYKTRKEALDALAAYNENPYDLSSQDITFGEVYEKWYATKEKTISQSTKVAYVSAYKYCKPIANIKIRDLRANALQKIVDSCPKTSSTKKNIRIVMNSTFNHAIKDDIISTNYADYITVEESDPVFERVPYSDEEILWLWDHSADRYDVQIILILLYTGMRVNELLQMPRDCCHLDEMYLDIKKAKNKASIRKVPIHHRIFGFVKAFYDKGGETLIVNKFAHTVVYGNFVNREYKRLNEEMNTFHRFHDTRHTFISAGHRYRLDDYCLRKIVGHEVKGVTLKVYTHVGLDELLAEINKIP